MDQSTLYKTSRMPTLRECVKVGDDGEMKYDVGARTTPDQLLRVHQSSYNSVALNFTRTH
jgi:hypothetical protein